MTFHGSFWLLGWEMLCLTAQIAPLAFAWTFAMMYWGGLIKLPAESDEEDLQ